MSSQKESAGRGMLAGLIREIDSLEAVIECEDGLTKMGKRTIQNTINWMKDRANSYARMNAKLNGGATPFPERCAGGVTPFDEGVPEVSERCAEGVPEVYTKEKVRKGKVIKEKKEDRFASIWVRVWLEVFGVEYQVAGGDKNAAKKFTGVTDEQFEMAARDYMESTVYKNKSLGNFQWRIGEYLNKQKPAPKEEKFMDASMIDGLVGGLDF